LLRCAPYARRIWRSNGHRIAALSAAAALAGSQALHPLTKQEAPGKMKMLALKCDPDGTGVSMASITAKR